MDAISIVLIILFAANFLWLGFLTYQVIPFIKERRAFHDKVNKASVSDVLVRQEKKIKQLGIDRDELYKASDAVSKRLSKSLTKCGLVRFNPFAGEGGKQSFSVSFLDDQNNGVVISSLYSRTTGSRIFAKPVSLGDSEINLTMEEKEAIKKAK